jgi:ABC-type sugar transport system ATPase subunit
VKVNHQALVKIKSHGDCQLAVGHALDEPTSALRVKEATVGLKYIVQAKTNGVGSSSTPITSHTPGREAIP